MRRGEEVGRLLTCRHVFETCEAVGATRVRAGIAAFVTSCEAAGKPAYHLFVNGKDANLGDIPLPVYLERGAALLALQNSWLEHLS